MGLHQLDAARLTVKVVVHPLLQQASRFDSLRIGFPIQHQGVSLRIQDGANAQEMPGAGWIHRAVRELDRGVVPQIDVVLKRTGHRQPCVFAVVG